MTADQQPAPRPSSATLDSVLGRPMPVLDHGFVRVVDYMGNDSSVVQAARVSYGAGTKKTSEDRALIRYLMRHRHTTPFEMCEIKLHVKLPIFVARQWVRHRTASINEVSARYSVLSREFYVPQGDQVGMQSTTNRQGRTEADAEVSRSVSDAVDVHNERAYQLYETLLDKGVSRELARMVLPVNVYTEWYWKTNLHNLLHFLVLRTDPHAQAEIRAYADVIEDVVACWVPMTFLAYRDYRRDGVTLSAAELDYVRSLNTQAGDPDVRDTLRREMSDREWREFASRVLGQDAP